MQKTVLITGIARGIGRAVCEKFLENGYQVIGTSQSGAAPYAHPNLELYPLHIESSSAVQTLHDHIAHRHIDILINNAGVLFVDKDVTHMSISELHRTLNVNLIGAIMLTEKLLQQIKDTGHIVNLSSCLGSLAEMDLSREHSPCPHSAYAISKAALNMYTRTLATRLQHRGIIVSSVHPGWVKTDMGGPNAQLEVEESAHDVYTFAISRPASGEFWYKGKPYAW